MALLHALVILLAVIALAMLPCLVVLIIFADRLFATTARAIRRARLRNVIEPSGPPLEQIAADLHRLGLTRAASTSGSVRHVAVTRAYDRRLVHACRALDIGEHLAELAGVDLELERLRVEGALLRAGFVLVSIEAELDVDGRQDHC